MSTEILTEYGHRIDLVEFAKAHGWVVKQAGPNAYDGPDGLKPNQVLLEKEIPNGTKPGTHTEQIIVSHTSSVKSGHDPSKYVATSHDRFRDINTGEELSAEKFSGFRARDISGAETWRYKNTVTGKTGTIEAFLAHEVNAEFAHNSKYAADYVRWVQSYQRQSRQLPTPTLYDFKLIRQKVNIVDLAREASNFKVTNETDKYVYLVKPNGKDFSVSKIGAQKFYDNDRSQTGYAEDFVSQYIASQPISIEQSFAFLKTFADNRSLDYDVLQPTHQLKAYEQFSLEVAMKRADILQGSHEQNLEKLNKIYENVRNLVVEKYVDKSSLPVLQGQDIKLIFDSKEAEVKMLLVKDSELTHQGLQTLFLPENIIFKSFNPIKTGPAVANALNLKDEVLRASQYVLNNESFRRAELQSRVPEYSKVNLLDVMTSDGFVVATVNKNKGIFEAERNGERISVKETNLGLAIDSEKVRGGDIVDYLIHHSNKLMRTLDGRPDIIATMRSVCAEHKSNEVPETQVSQARFEQLMKAVENTSTAFLEHVKDLQSPGSLFPYLKRFVMDKFVNGQTASSTEFRDVYRNETGRKIEFKQPFKPRLYEKSEKGFSYFEVNTNGSDAKGVVYRTGPFLSGAAVKNSVELVQHTVQNRNLQHQIEQ